MTNVHHPQTLFIAVAKRFTPRCTQGMSHYKVGLHKNVKIDQLIVELTVK